MIIDKIENQELYSSLSARMGLAFSYLNDNDLLHTPNGKYEIDGENVFAIVMEYETKEESECKLEGHHKYIDLQYIVSGHELIGLSTLTDQKPYEQNKEHDYDLYDVESDLINFNSGMFMIFFPDDIHMPGVRKGEISMVKKVVVKIKI